MSSNTGISFFFDSLTKVFQELEQKVADLESRENSSKAYFVKDDLKGIPSEASEELLEEVQKMSLNVQELNDKLEEEVDNLRDNFLPQVYEQFDELRCKFQNYEAWASQYGYDSILKSDFAGCEVHIENVAEEQNRVAKTEKEEKNEELKRDEEDAKGPNLFDIGLSKKTLQLFGYQFKDDHQRMPDESDDPKEPLLVSMQKVNHNRSLELDNPPQLASMQKVKKFDESCETTMSTDDDSTPAGILKKPTLFTEDSSVVDASRIELTPGLYVRQKPRSQPNSLKSKPIAIENQNPNEGMESPKTPVLTTVNLKALGSRAKLLTTNKTMLGLDPQSSEPPQSNYVTPTKGEDTPIRTPEEKVPQDSGVKASPQTPKTPQLSNTTLNILKNHK